eukprot:CAMPEP_0119012696 /NCGR_PEP_ID=MMETSP1176-20130426/7282_1 /TAXON_ID=265551 /ORGANISM="Synedropsis recta cf, Strain CCMP1620" /LENGTH=274 /DNA_ID=CAMNT_0006965707 /DNA_START=70 /DNA_END=894 /DNA_ORIENTATION=+
MIMKLSRVLLFLVLLPSTTAQVRGARTTASTNFDGFARSEIQILADAPSIKDSRQVIHNMNKRRLGPAGFTKKRGAGSFADSQPIAVADKQSKGRMGGAGKNGSPATGKGVESSSRFNFVQDVYDTAVGVDDFDDATTPTLEEEGTVFTFRNFTIASQQVVTDMFFASGVCTRTEGDDPAFRGMSYCDFTYSLQDALFSSFSASGAVLDAFATSTGGFSGGGILGITGGTGLYFGAIGEVQVTPFFEGVNTTTTTIGDFFLDAGFYIVNATLII